MESKQVENFASTSHSSRQHPVFFSSHTRLTSSNHPHPNTKMKRKKWTGDEERTLIDKYSDLQTSGALLRLRTREKKFQPIADHVNSLHHLRDSTTFPFRWSWRDVSVKVQNMRHQYLGVKQKIRVSDEEFNWSDGQDHWTNFFKYKEVFGDVELDTLGGGLGKSVEDQNDDGCCGFYGNDVLGLGEDFDEEVGLLSEGDEQRRRGKRVRKDEAIGIIGAEIMDVRDLVNGREEKRGEREFRKEEEGLSRYERDWEREDQNEERRMKREEEMEVRELEWELEQRLWVRKESESRLRFDREFNKERKRWMASKEEKREKEELAWRERMLAMQIEQENRVMEMHEVAIQNQMQVLGVLVGFMCQFVGSGNNAVVGLGALTPQVLHNLQQHQGGFVGDSGKPADVNSDSHFM